MWKKLLDRTVEGSGRERGVASVQAEAEDKFGIVYELGDVVVLNESSLARHQCTEPLSANG